MTLPRRLCILVDHQPERDQWQATAVSSEQGVLTRTAGPTLEAAVGNILEELGEVLDELERRKELS